MSRPMQTHHGDERISAVARSVRAPEPLRARVDAERDRTLVRRLVVRRLKLAGALSVPAAALGVVVGLLAGTPAPTALEAAAPAALAAAAPAPVVDREHPGSLAVAVEGVRFPEWEGWRPTGQRTDEIEGRETRTVFYEDQGATVGYTIVAGEALAWPDDARVVERGGVALHVLERDGRRLVFWRVAGQTCILSAPASVPEEALVSFAASEPYVA